MKPDNDCVPHRQFIVSSRSTHSASGLLLCLDWPAAVKGLRLAAQRQPALWSRDTRIPLQAAPGTRVEMLDKTTISCNYYLKGPPLTRSLITGMNK